MSFEEFNRMYKKHRQLIDVSCEREKEAMLALDRESQQVKEKECLRCEGATYEERLAAFADSAEAHKNISKRRDAIRAQAQKERAALVAALPEPPAGGRWVIEFK